MRPAPALGWAVALPLLLAAAAAPAVADTLERVRSKGRLDVCFSSDALPFSSRDGARPGFERELADALGAGLGVGVEPTWLLLRGEVRFTRCDAAMSAIAEDDDGPRSPAAAGGGGGPTTRLRRALSRPYMVQRQRLVVRREHAPVRALADLGAEQVGALHGGFTHQLLHEAGLRVRTYMPSEPAILDEVERGAVAAGVVSNVYFGWYGAQHPGNNLAWVPDLVLDRALDYPVAVNLRNTDRALVDAVDAVLDRLLADGTVARILGRYGIADAAASP